jgi:hypothetical protein
MTTPTPLPADYPCVDCGNDAPHGNRCTTCHKRHQDWRARQPRCIDCGGFNGMAHRGPRCRPCHLTHRSQRDATAEATA